VTWDLGPQALLVLVVMSVGFGIITQAILWNTGVRLAWLIGMLAFFVIGILVSEVWFGWATAEELQPNIDGLSFDEVLIALLVSALLVVGVRFLLLRGRHHGPASAH
jgi:hypothetical protein